MKQFDWLAFSVCVPPLNSRCLVSLLFRLFAGQIRSVGRFGSPMTTKRRQCRSGGIPWRRHPGHFEPSHQQFLSMRHAGHFVLWERDLSTNRFIPASKGLPTDNPTLLIGHHWTPIGSARSGVCLCGTCVFVCSKFLLSPLKMSGSSTLLMFHQTTGQSGARSWMHPFLCGDGGGRFEKNCRSSSKRVHPYDQ